MHPLALSLTVLLASSAAMAQPRIFLAIGAHAGDMEITAGAVLAKQKAAGDRIAILHLTLGEGGNPKMPAERYAVQKRREAREAANALGAEVLFAPFADGSLQNDEPTRKYVAAAIAKLKPTHVITHWKNSLHHDHSTTHAIVNEAVLLAALSGARSVRGIYYTDNWEDAEGFQPYLFVNVTSSFAAWREAVARYEFIRGGISSFPYLDYYESLARVRGAIAGKPLAVAFDLDSWAKKRVIEKFE